MPERRNDAESVHWASLEVYGPPEEVPVALHAIWSSDPERRMLGYEYLSDRLVHQGSRSPASAAAVPFLIDVVADPAAPDRFAACQVLRQIAIGEEEFTLNERPNFAHLRQEAARRATMTVEELKADEAAWVAGAADLQERAARERRTSFSNVERDRLTEQWDIEAYDAVRAGVPVYVVALSANHPATQIYAAQLLAYFPEESPSVVPALIPLIGGEDPIVASAAAVAAGICARGTEDPAAAAAIAARWERAENLAERWATGIGLAQLLNDPGPEILADVEAATEAPAPVPHFPFLDGDIAAVAAYTLDRLEDRHTTPSGPWRA
ncbi:HEAT repeat domain-containing protein [Jidongwangia harbinensis]|uniref:HEAT repeat domain-containing protein n=1 Tax=Jidongwangia harbinensis TaxID=2878561 RepID=UPI001CDA40BB|nr:HEAT repeat domain-containing protein [Jidongwangia harbinensis]MCA2218230.1 HEAT repeat domain-containing protein [Jidongwangia harbinensis]